MGFTTGGRDNLICLIKRDVFECASFREIVYCTRLFARLVEHAAHFLVDSFLIFDGAENMGTMDVIPWIPRSASKVLDGVGRDFDIHFVELGMIIIQFTPVAVDHSLP